MRMTKTIYVACVCPHAMRCDVMSAVNIRVLMCVLSHHPTSSRVYLCICIYVCGGGGSSRTAAAQPNILPYL
jgi:hypothetical protein